jgi:metal-responsive CopG/Arc/MetJ family transcriptional regulator
MARTTATFTISLPPEMLAELERVRRQEHRTRSELIREALRRYLEGVLREAGKEGMVDSTRP